MLELALVGLRREPEDALPAGAVRGPRGALGPIQDEVAAIGPHRKHRVTVAIRLPCNRQQQVPGGNAGLHEPAALLQRIVLAIANRCRK